MGVGAAAAATGDPDGEAAGLTAGEAAAEGEGARTGDGAATGDTAALGAAAVVGLAAGGAVVGAAGAVVGVGGACEQPAIAAASATTTSVGIRREKCAKLFASLQEELVRTSSMVRTVDDHLPPLSRRADAGVGSASVQVRLRLS